MDIHRGKKPVEQVDELGVPSSNLRETPGASNCINGYVQSDNPKMVLGLRSFLKS
jgi:hypothetical protein